MKSGIKRLVAITATLLFAFNGSALELKGSASVDYGFGLSGAERSEAEAQAAANAIRRWVSEKHPDQYENYQFVQQKIESDIDRYLLSPPRIIDETKKNGRYTTVIAVDVDTTLIEREFLRKSDIATAGEKNRLAFVFVARKYIGAERKGDKSSDFSKSQDRDLRTERRGEHSGQLQSSETRNDSKYQILAKGQEREIGVSRDVGTAQQRKTEIKGVGSASGGSSTQSKQTSGEISKEDYRREQKSETKSVRQSSIEHEYEEKVLWDISTSNEVDTAMGAIFRRAKYKVVSTDFMEELSDHAFSIRRFKDDYAKGNDLRSSTVASAITGLNQISGQPVQYLAIGTLDVDKPFQDPKTGNVSVFVSVTGQALDIQEYGTAVAKVGPVQFKGEGPTALVARNNALSLAAEACAKQMVAQMSSGNDR